MARIRTIKPEFQQSDSMCRISRDARLCFILLWPQADDTGRLRAHSRMLASVLFPVDDDAPMKIDDWLDELERAGSIRRYEVDGHRYIEIQNWQQHQKVDHPQPSKFPAPTENSRIFANGLEHSGEDQGSRIKERIKEPPIVPQGGLELVAVNGEAVQVLKSPFELFWEKYPHKVGKGAAEKSFAKASPQAPLAVMLEAIERYIRCKPPDQAFCNPATWLNQHRWLDERVAASPKSQAFL